MIGRGHRSGYRVHTVANETSGLLQMGGERMFRSWAAFLESEESKCGLWLGRACEQQVGDKRCGLARSLRPQVLCGAGHLSEQQAALHGG